ncbi:hypothetical protein [Rhodoligotrophos appendicifer]|uniref:hypothetical protein n=1 Tax=Rhodoligotrophos appendicifer TaxID=987056 RepID=UPI001186073A|nr:hypothetical protein [Rhodoligotrophos appendicifer]
MNRRIVVHRHGDIWKIGIDGKSYDEFVTQVDAITRALEWSRNAKQQGCPVDVFLENESGNIVPLETPTKWLEYDSEQAAWRYHRLG